MQLDNTTSFDTAVPASQDKHHYWNPSYEMHFGLDSEQGFLMLDTSLHLI